MMRKFGGVYMNDYEIKQLKDNLTDIEQLCKDTTIAYADIMRDHRLLRHIAGDDIVRAEISLSGLPEDVAFAIEAGNTSIMKMIVKNNQRFLRLIDLLNEKNV